MMNETSSRQAGDACWTCRRRRLKCDRTLPFCQKCTSQNHSCLGYNKEKPLRWTNSVASRGKLMGKAVPSQEDPVSIARLLLDPGLQDLSPATRGYITYFELQCCQECVLNSCDSNNAFKEFMRLIPSCPGLCHTVVSVAALHQAQRSAANVLRGHDKNWAFALIDSQSSEAMKCLQQLPAYHDALHHKQKTLNYLREQCSRNSLDNPDGVFASILLSIWLELMDSGRNFWKYHLHGLREVMQKQSFRGSLAASFSYFAKYFEANYAIFEIIGSTFINDKQPYQPLFTKIPTLEILKLSESQTWIGCPAELLYTLSLINSASSNTKQMANLVQNIISLLQNFSPMKWAVNSPNMAYITPRYHVARIYRTAVEIYASQTLRPHLKYHQLTEWSTENSLDSIISSIRSIDPMDGHYKALCWPVFVIGAETETSAQRESIVESFEHLWTIWRSQNVKNGLRVLEKIWALRATQEASSSRCWIDYVYESGEQWMFV